MAHGITLRSWFKTLHNLVVESAVLVGELFFGEVADEEEFILDGDKVEADADAGGALEEGRGGGEFDEEGVAAVDLEAVAAGGGGAGSDEGAGEFSKCGGLGAGDFFDLGKGGIGRQGSLTNGEDGDSAGVGVYGGRVYGAGAVFGRGNVGFKEGFGPFVVVGLVADGGLPAGAGLVDDEPAGGEADGEAGLGVGVVGPGQRGGGEDSGAGGLEGGGG